MHVTKFASRDINDFLNVERLHFLNYGCLSPDLYNKISHDKGTLRTKKAMENLNTQYNMPKYEYNRHSTQ